MKHHRSTNVSGRISIVGSTSGGQYKSKLERHGFIRWFMDPTVEQVMLQSPVIRYVDAAGTPHRYTGDLAITFRDHVGRRPLVIELKYQKKLDSDPSLKPKHEAVGGVFRADGREFLVHTEREVYTPDFPMLRFAFEHLNNPPHAADREILASIRGRPGITAAEVISSLRSNRLAQLELLPAIWRLVSLHQISVDFKKSLNLAAKLTPMAV